MRIVVKVGTQSILSKDGTPLESVMASIVAQIATLQEKGHLIILVSSGAVSSGRKVARQLFQKEYGESIGEKQVLASLGQHELMHVYAKMFKKYHILVSQLLLTKQDFYTRKHYLNIFRLLTEILDHKNIIPIVNENDTVAIEELMFTDNDELAGLIAAQMKADKLIILSNVEGVYRGHPDDPEAYLIPVIDPQKGWPSLSNAKSPQGRGGMISKISTARKMSGLGITTHIASINEPLVLIRLVGGDALGTQVLPSHKKSNLKRWIAYTTEPKNGSILITSCLHKILAENKSVVSILPVGIEKYVGDFKKGDLVDILAPHHEKIGAGIAKYSAAELKEYCGQKNKPVFIHYDYLHIF